MTTTYAIYRCSRLRLGKIPTDECLVEIGFSTAREAMARAVELRSNDPAHSYMIGAA